MGRLGWTPGVFWAATPCEHLASRAGWAEGQAPSRPGGPLSADAIETLEDLKRRFPD